MKTATGGDRRVVLTNGTEYVHNFNTAFAIVVLGTREGASELLLSQAAEVLKDLRRYGTNKLWAELTGK